MSKKRRDKRKDFQIQTGEEDPSEDKALAQEDTHEGDVVECCDVKMSCSRRKNSLMSSNHERVELSSFRESRWKDRQEGKQVRKVRNLRKTRKVRKGQMEEEVTVKRCAATCVPARLWVPRFLQEGKNRRMMRRKKLREENAREKMFGMARKARLVLLQLMPKREYRKKREASKRTRKVRANITGRVSGERTRFELGQHTSRTASVSIHFASVRQALASTLRFSTSLLILFFILFFLKKSTL